MPFPSSHPTSISVSFHFSNFENVPAGACMCVRVRVCVCVFVCVVRYSGWKLATANAYSLQTLCVHTYIHTHTHMHTYIHTYIFQFSQTLKNFLVCPLFSLLIIKIEIFIAVPEMCRCLLSLLTLIVLMWRIG